MVQEKVRDHLEFGRYRHESGLSMIQYMERCILQNRQLIPPISDQHLFRKLARHYHHDIAVACITREVNNITEFQMLLMEFAALHKINDGGTDNHRAEVPAKQEQLKHVTRPWQNNLSLIHI